LSTYTGSVTYVLVGVALAAGAAAGAAGIGWWILPVLALVGFVLGAVDAATGGRT
jgi:hypothetical protein